MKSLLNISVILPGYCITELIYSSSKTLVYRGIREEDQKPVIIKLMGNEYPTFIEIAQFRHQYTITKDLDVPGVIKSYSLENYQNAYALVMEDFGGISLKEWKLQENANRMKTFLDISIQITKILEGVHRHRIIHKDIKPANILIQPATLEVKLIDFSIASLLPKEIASIASPNLLEGTLAYISPEQTGRMNRQIDYRTDFYSLGVTLFELLTGKLPFATNDATELIYCHIAKEPASACSIDPNIPVVVSDIINKLMAKNAEDRYQNAAGLKHDLEVCIKTLDKTGNIPYFQLGTKDVSDRFLIPEKLYGREFHIRNLLTHFSYLTSPENKNCVEMMLVTGYSGVGKTAVVNEIHKPIAQSRGYFISGKYQQLKRNIPFSGLVEAFRDLIQQLLSESDTEIQRWKEKILSVLGEEGKVITDIIPELEIIIGEQPPAAKLSGTAAENRFNLLFQRFIQLFAIKKHPLVIFLDDLQWADAASLELIKLLMSQGQIVSTNPSSSFSILNEDCLLLIGAYRDNEVSNSHPLQLTLKEVAKAGTVINNINLEPLSQTDLNRLIAETLHCEEKQVISLTQMVFAKTKGNPFFSHKFLKALYEEGLIKFSFDIGKWEYDITHIKTLSLTDDVVEFMVIQLGKLPRDTQEVLKISACVGNTFDLNILSCAYGKSAIDTASSLWPSLMDGLVLPQTEVRNLFEEEIAGKSGFWELPAAKYKFVHDRVHQAAYSLISEKEKKVLHRKIGRLLLQNTPESEREEKIFDIVNQFNQSLDLITEQGERDELAKMNLIAGSRALAAVAYVPAMEYLTAGINLLPADSWDNSYELTLNLYGNAAEAAFLKGEFSKMEELVDVVLQKGKIQLDKIKVYEVKIKAYGAQGKALEAVDLALSVLKSLGVEFPENITQEDVQHGMAEITANLAGRNIEELIDLPQMKDTQVFGVMQILGGVAPIAYAVAPELFLLIVFKQINFSLQYGNTSLSSYAYSCYGVILSGVVGDIESGYQFGKLSVSLLDKFDAREVKAKTIMAFNAGIRHGKEHCRTILKPLLEAYSIALEIGDFEFAASSVLNYCSCSYFIGKELAELEKEMVSYSNTITKIKQERILNWNNIYQQSVFNLRENVENNCCLTGQYYNEEKMQMLHLEAKDRTGLILFYFNKLYLCYLFHDFPQAVEIAIQAEQYLDAAIGIFLVPLFYFYNSLARLAVYPDSEEYEQKHILDKVRANQEQMKHWAHHAPMNFWHKFYLVEAELHRVLGEYLQAMDCYENAITLAKEHEYIHEEALANELTAKFYLQLNKHKIAQNYITDAYYGYLRWGALAKANDLTKRYPQLLTAILQREVIRENTILESTIGVYPSLVTLSNQQTLISSKSSISDSLDLAAVIKASVALSGEIQMEQLLSTLMQVVMENAGASKCALVLTEGDTLTLTLAAVSSNLDFAPISKFPSIPLESSNDVPVTLINYVKRTREISVIDDVNSVNKFANDSYIASSSPKSILCIPIINQGKMLGILYLENNLSSGAFTYNRVELLKLLTTQAAISLENAHLYRNLAKVKESLEEYSHTLEDKVEVRTQEINDKRQKLEKTLEELKNTQSQLIQTEKMSSLGQMVAGIAHEINNPINFIHGNINYAIKYIQDILDLIDIFHEEYPEPSPKLVDKATDIDLDFLLEDLPKLLESMKVGTTRIRNIVLGLRNFSRLDESEMKPVDIHEGIDNTLMILQHRIKAKSERPEIEIIKEYGDLPEISCYAGQLNQVFMNILSNAIDAVEESLIDNQGKISICTEKTHSNTVKIKIADNGAGISADVVRKIFDPFFTTKPVGSGTGLGLSISYQIIVDKHKGKLLCNSTPGEGTEFVIEIPMRQ
ncbi:MAG: AAA family ATPase [Scytonematopsis contorta HA4267-MV1]|jgi:predicted ATPase/signal transduction histidine kinase|nr:AAA family ATPase [Scytonematopsis contorta HA4267-MV1]